MPIRMASAFAGGLLWMSLGFNVMHDASHYAVSLSPTINQTLSRVWNQWGMWNHLIWFYHHVVEHHSHTGVEKKDPDLYHLRPFVKKISSDSSIISVLVPYKTIVTPFISSFLPGLYVGQIISYLQSWFDQQLWSIFIPSRYSIMDIFLFIMACSMLIVAADGPSYVYLFSLNFWYHINILPDHDMIETRRHHTESRDWLRIQVQHSGDFYHRSWWSTLFGGINYQIEHHLFPNMANEHYPLIKPIVQSYCNEKGIPYVYHDSLVEAYYSSVQPLEEKNE
jgi:fatty acid desaturase